MTENRSVYEKVFIEKLERENIIVNDFSILDVQNFSYITTMTLDKKVELAFRTEGTFIPDFPPSKKTVDNVLSKYRSFNDKNTRGV